jgi:RES domain-containing protein
MSAQDDLEEDLRRRFGPDVVILHHFPPKDEIAAKESWLERIAGLVGVQGWMWRSKWGVTIALIVVGPTVKGFIDFYQPTVTIGIEYAKPYIGVLKSTSVGLSEDLVAFLQKEPSQKGHFEVARALIVPMARDNPIGPVGDQLFQLDATLFRYSSNRYGSPLVSGTSASSDGRWHTRRPSLLYTTDNLLAGLEEARLYEAFFPLDLMLYELRVRTLAESASPEVARAVAQDDRTRTQRFGNAWADARRSGALVTPSRLVPSAHTVILNLALMDQMSIEVLQSYPIRLA